MHRAPAARLPHPCALPHPSWHERAPARGSRVSPSGHPIGTSRAGPLTDMPCATPYCSQWAVPGSVAPRSPAHPVSATDLSLLLSPVVPVGLGSGGRGGLGAAWPCQRHRPVPTTVAQPGGNGGERAGQSGEEEAGDGCRPPRRCQESAAGSAHPELVTVSWLGCGDVGKQQGKLPPLSREGRKAGRAAALAWGKLRHGEGTGVERCHCYNGGTWRGRKRAWDEIGYARASLPHSPTRPCKVLEVPPRGLRTFGVGRGPGAASWFPAPAHALGAPGTKAALRRPAAGPGAGTAPTGQGCRLRAAGAAWGQSQAATATLCHPVSWSRCPAPWHGGAESASGWTH